MWKETWFHAAGDVAKRAKFYMAIVLLAHKHNELYVSAGAIGCLRKNWLSLAALMLTMFY